MTGHLSEYDRLDFEVLLAQPRAFCAGVERAIQTVELALERRAPDDERPVYVRREIVHNKTVVDELRERGAVFVHETHEIPEGATTVFSAHGVAPQVRIEAAARGLETIDATCPLVARVHASVRRHLSRDYTILYIGGAGHDEVEGVIGEAPDRVILLQSVADAAAVEVADRTRVAYSTETTFALDDVAAITDVLRARFPAIVGPDEGDVCYAVQNRQEAVRALIEQHGAQVVLVVGSSNSANSRRLCEVAVRTGARSAHLLGSAAELDPAWLGGIERVGVSAGASAPERLVQPLVSRLRELGASSVRSVELRIEDVTFTLPTVPDHRSRRADEPE
jgi:4-hydroxy-3-methylbut-2-enyl diphosphate reductase